MTLPLSKKKTENPNRLSKLETPRNMIKTHKCSLQNTQRRKMSFDAVQSINFSMQDLSSNKFEHFRISTFQPEENKESPGEGEGLRKRWKSKSQEKPPEKDKHTSYQGKHRNPLRAKRQNWNAISWLIDGKEVTTWCIENEGSYKRWKSKLQDKPPKNTNISLIKAEHKNPLRAKMENWNAISWRKMVQM